MKCKYPKTPHLPWSHISDPDDVKVMDTSHFNEKQIVVSVKLDGENSTISRDYYHARSLDSNNHPSRDWCKAYHGQIKHHIPEGWRICGENVYAKHSIHYTNLESYFYIFSIWTEDNKCLSWEETKEWASLLDLPTPPELFLGYWDEKVIKNLKIDETTTEGYVVRLQKGFLFENFRTSIAKYVRPGHVQTDKHWTTQPIIPNLLRVKPALA